MTLDALAGLLGSEVAAALWYLLSLAGLEAVRRLPNAQGDEAVACVLILLGLTATGVLAYLLAGLVVPLAVLGVLGVLLVVSFWL